MPDRDGWASPTSSQTVPPGDRETSRVRDVTVEVREHLRTLRAARLISPREFEGVWRGFARLTRWARSRQT